MLQRIKDEMSTNLDMEKPYCPSPYLLLWFALILFFSQWHCKRKKLHFEFLSTSLTLYFSL